MQVWRVMISKLTGSTTVPVQSAMLHPTRVPRTHRAPALAAVSPPSAAAAALLNMRVPGSNVSLKELAESESTFDLDNVTTRDVRAISYVSRQRMLAPDFDPDAVDEEGLPLVYNEDRIAEFWRSRPSELTQRWTRFAGACPSHANLAARVFFCSRNIG